MVTQLLKILRESIKAVPAMKYALAVAGILAVVAMVGAFKISPSMAVFGAVITLVLMVAMVVFARLTTTAPRHFFLPVQIMMWAFLIVTVGTAFLLFTSAFFQWPRGLRELIGPPVAVAAPAPAPPDETAPLIAAARHQCANRDYNGAWNTLARAIPGSPGAKAIRDEQTQTAMAWINDMEVTAPATYTSTLMPLTEHLHRELVEAKGPLAADIHAHLGFANFLRSRNGADGLAIDEEYTAALAIDPKNPFAHAMRGHWLATRKRSLEEVVACFRRALETSRARPAVQRFHLAALDWLGIPEAGREAVRVADEMRRNQEPIATKVRLDIVRNAYPRTGRDMDAELLALLPPADHLATYRWLIESRNLENAPIESYYLARLTEATGDFAGAAALYRPLVSINTNFKDRIAAGLARCEQQLGK